MMEGRTSGDGEREGVQVMEGVSPGDGGRE